MLPYECHFERGGIDPAPILSQVEAQSKKKGKAAAAAQNARAPSPGSQVRQKIFFKKKLDNYHGSLFTYTTMPINVCV